MSVDFPYCSEQARRLSFESDTGVGVGFCRPAGGACVWGVTPRRVTGQLCEDRSQKGGATVWSWKNITAGVWLLEGLQ